MRKRIAVLASGGGSNLQAILDYFDSLGDARSGDVVVVISDKPTAGALDRTRARGIPAVVSAPDKVGDVLEEYDVDIVALAGYLRFVPTEVTRRYRGRMINVHPALLPKFGGKGMYGERVHAAVIAAGETESGPTVHFVDDVYDHGAIIAQSTVPVYVDDIPHSLAQRVLAEEHKLFPRVLNDLAAGNISLTSGNVVTRHASRVTDHA